MNARSLTYGPRGWRVARFRLRGYLRRLRWPVRILAWLASAGLASLAGWQYAALGPLAFEVAFLLSVIAQARRVRGLPRPAGVSGPAADAIRAEARRHAALPRVPSPGGWTVPPGIRPAWNWTPPPGIEPRLDRVPLWARLWYGTPFADRYAHVWLWNHGGWDVVPPEYWSPSAP